MKSFGWKICGYYFVDAMNPKLRQVSFRRE